MLSYKYFLRCALASIVMMCTNSVAAVTPYIGMTYLNNAQAQPDVPINDAWNKLDITASGLANKLALTVTTSVALTNAQAIQNPWIFGGSPASPVTITTPAATSFVRSVYNNTGKILTILPSGGSSVTIPIGAYALIFSDGTAAVSLAPMAGTATPGTAISTGAGTGGTCTASGNDQAGELTIVAGTTPSAAAVVCTMTFSSAYAATPAVVFSPSNADAVGAAVFMTATTTTAVVTSTTSLVNGTTYKVHYIVKR